MLGPGSKPSKPQAHHQTADAVVATVRQQAHVWKPFGAISRAKEVLRLIAGLVFCSVLSSQAWSTTVLWGAGQGLRVEEKDEDPEPRVLSGAWFRFHPAQPDGRM